MEHEQMPDTYDYRQYDQIWQRISPTLDPYPGMKATARTAESQLAVTPPPTVNNTTPPPSMDHPAIDTLAIDNIAIDNLAVENLPGAEDNPCCMGSAAADSLEVLQGFIDDEISDKRFYLAFSRQAPSWARQTLRELSEDESAHAKRLLAVYYLITGQCYQPTASYERIRLDQFCPMLRERYHVEACGGFNYARAADGTTDPCLSKLLMELSDDEYHHADRMMMLLERAMR